MLAATPGGLDLGRLLLDLLIVLVIAKAAAELAERLRIPAVLGEIGAGILIGPSVLGWISIGGERGVSLAVIAEIGVLLLLLQVGMEMDLAELGKVGKASMSVAIIGVAIPFAAGALAGLALGEPGKTAIFLGAALTATSVGITARVFGDLRALATTEARIVLGAAVADDVLGLVILTVVVKVVTGGDVGVGTVLGTVGLAVGFLVVTGLLGVSVVPRLLGFVQRHASSGATLTVVGLIITLAFAQLADMAKLAFIIGAFMAGLALGRSAQHERIASDLGAAGNLFIPVFFVQIGLNTDLSAFGKPSVLGLAGVLTVVGILGKLVAAFGARSTRADKLLIGLGMVPRGEVGLIFASIGLTNGVLTPDLYGAVIIVVLITTVITPPLLRFRIGSTSGPAPSVAAEPSPEPVEGWLEVSGGSVHLRATPSDDDSVTVALRTAALLPDARPGADLLDWFGDRRAAPLEWSQRNTPALVRLLRSDEPRAWRFLDVTGVLQRALPEVADAMARRRADISDLDPAGALRFNVVDRLHALDVELGFPADDLVIAALVVDVCRDSAPTAGCGTALLNRLVTPADADRILAVVADASLLRAGVRDPDSFDEREVLQLAIHLASAAHARDAYALALAIGPLSKWQREMLDQRQLLVQQLLDHPEFIGSEATNLAASRRAAAERLTPEPAVIDRLRFAPMSYLLSFEAEELARQAQLVEPLPRSGVVRVSVTPEPTPEHWRIDVACRDRDALLAHLTAALTTSDFDIVSASIATWPDGAVLDSFVVTSARRPSARELAGAFEAGLRRPLHPTPMPDLQISFDNEALPWHTSCMVTGRDHQGALSAVTAALASAKVVVHTARVTTDGERVNDRFSVSDRIGRKLDAAAMSRVKAALAGDKPRRFALR
jgi:Kef-type K+ transport system membrane component KefB